jgi:hypothetical protein
MRQSSLLSLEQASRATSSFSFSAFARKSFRELLGGFCPMPLSAELEERLAEEEGEPPSPESPVSRAEGLEAAGGWEEEATEREVRGDEAAEGAMVEGKAEGVGRFLRALWSTVNLMASAAALKGGWRGRKRVRESE